MSKKRLACVMALAGGILAVAAWAAEAPKHPESTADWKDLFAKDLSDRGLSEGRVGWENGELTATKDEAIWTAADYENFALDLEFKNSEAANSGVFLYCSDMDKWITSCIEVQILDDYADKWADVAPNWTCGGVFGRLAPPSGPSNPTANGTASPSTAGASRWTSC